MSASISERTADAASHTPPRIASFEKKPDERRHPRERQRADDEDMRRLRHRAGEAPHLKMSLVPTAWITAPAARNSRALKKPWVSRWKKPAPGAPAPAAAIM